MVFAIEGWKFLPADKRLAREGKGEYRRHPGDTRIGFPRVFMKSLFGYAIICAPLLAALLLAPADAHSQTQTGALKGKVKERNGKALEGVIVRATSADNKEDKRETKSNNKGDFEFAEIPAGQYSLSFEKQGYKTFNTRKLEIAAGETTKLSSVVELAREGEPYAIIRGAVFHGPGFTLPNVTVIIERMDGGKKFKQETISQEGGEFAFRLKAEKAKYRITATARSFQPTSIEVEIDGDEARNVALTLQPVK
jgi:Carboxypeptidase regulatory-like domain